MRNPEKRCKRNLKRRKGGVLAYVLIAFLAISILTLSILFVFNNNLKMATAQEKDMEAYYLAYSGIEIGYAALLANDSAKLKELTRLTNPVSEHKQNGISIGNGTVDLTAKISNKVGFENWIEIIATATVTRNGVTYKRILYFDPNNPENLVWTDQ